jgi:hypothetical protein
MNITLQKTLATELKTLKSRAVAIEALLKTFESDAPKVKTTRAPSEKRRGRPKKVVAGTETKLA